METVVILIMILVGFSFALKLTYHKLPGILLTSGVVALFVGMSWSIAINQSVTQIAGWLADTSLMLDISVLLTIDVVVSMGFCILTAQKQSADAMSRGVRMLLIALQWFPGLLIFPTTFSMLVYSIFTFTGADFPTVAWTLAAVIFLLSVALAYGIRYLLPEQELRLEMSFLVSALIAVLGIVATVNGRTAVAGTNSVEWGAVAGVAAIAVVGAAAGLAIYNRKTRKK